MLKAKAKQQKVLDRTMGSLTTLEELLSRIQNAETDKMVRGETVQKSSLCYRGERVAKCICALIIPALSCTLCEIKVQYSVVSRGQ